MLMCFYAKLTSLGLAPALLKRLRAKGIDVEEEPPTLPSVVWYNSDDEFFYSNCRDRKIMESFVIQAYGEERMDPCTKCEKSKHEESGRLGRYLECRTLEGFFKGICGNCKRDDHGAECSHGEEWIAAEQKAAEKEASKNRPRDTRNSARAGRA